MNRAAFAYAMLAFLALATGGACLLALAPAAVLELFHEHPIRVAMALFPATAAVVLALGAAVHAWRGETFDTSKPMPRYAVVIAARNEERLLARTLERVVAEVGLRADVHVVSDASTDGTVAVASAYADRGVHVHELRQRGGKSAALEYALSRVDAPYIVTLDADTLPDKGAIDGLVRAVGGQGVGAATGAIRARPAGVLGALQAFEYATVIGLCKRLEDLAGALFTVSGAAAAFSTDAVRAVGGFRSASATEDIDLTWRLQRAGYRVRYAADAGFEVESPSSPRALFAQRSRWALGCAQVLRRNGNPLHFRRSAFGAIVAYLACSILYVPLLLASVFAALVTWCGFGLEPFSSAAALAIVSLTFEAMLVQAALGFVLSRGGGLRWFAWAGAALAFPLYHLVVLVPAFVVGSLRSLRETSSAVWERSERADRESVAGDPVGAR